MRSTKLISKYQFAAFRILLGLYLIIHFIGLLPYGPELFSNQGVLSSARLNLTHGAFPNPLEHWDSPFVVNLFLLIMLALAISFAVGCARRTTAVLLWYGWACLFNRNNLISNPSIPYVGLLLLLSPLVPIGEPFSLRRRKAAEEWEFPSAVYWVAWWLMAVGYTFSGCMKLDSPSWIDGTALVHLVNNPLARPGPFRDIFLSLPAWATKANTWAVLGLEILFVPLSFHRRTRLFAWTAMVIVHMGILLMVDFADLSFGMVMIHLFTFEPEWLPVRRFENGQSVVLFDGVCGLCDRTVQFLLGEDVRGVLRFAPLQGAAAKRVLGRHGSLPTDIKSLIFVRNFGAPDEIAFVRSRGALLILDELGGFWRVVSWMRIVPQPLRDRIYSWVARNRYKWFGRYEECRIPAPATRAKFLD